MMKRQDVWIMEYHKRRYMAHLNREELEQRAKDIMLNQLVLTEKNMKKIKSDFIP